MEGSHLERSDMEGSRSTTSEEHVVMLPWLAMGHLIPFLHLAEHLASRGIKVSFISTPSNLRSLPTPTSSLLNFIPIPLPATTPQLPESSMQIAYHKQPLLKTAYDSLQHPVAAFLRRAHPKPQHIIFDFAAPWIPSIAAEIGASSVYFGLFSASTLSFFGPPDAFLDKTSRATAEAFTVLPDWITIPSNIVYRLHEVLKFFKIHEESGSTDSLRFAGSIGGCDFVAIRSSPEFESEWIHLLSDQIYKKPVIPVGFIFPSAAAGDEDWGSDIDVKKWLDDQNSDSVLYVALGTEGVLSQDELTELAHGLEDSGLPFLWVLRTPPESTRDVLDTLPEGFKERVEGRGFLCTRWAPQVRILRHEAVRGFLTHCGWNSVIEGLGFGRVLVLLPLVNDQGLVARLVEGKRVGVEIPRKEVDGSFTRRSVAETVRLAVAEEGGEGVRENARKMKGVFGDEDLNNGYIESFIRFLRNNKKKSCS